MIEHIPYKPEHAKDIIAYGATGYCGDYTAEQIETLANVKLNGAAFTCVYNGRIVSCGGYELMWAGVAQAWFLCVNDINPLLIKDSKRKFLEITKGISRVQAPLRSDFPVGVRFAEYMGFKLESVMKRFHPDGTDALMYVLEIE